MSSDSLQYLVRHLHTVVSMLELKKQDEYRQGRFDAAIDHIVTEFDEFLSSYIWEQGQKLLEQTDRMIVIGGIFAGTSPTFQNRMERRCYALTSEGFRYIHHMSEYPGDPSFVISLPTQKFIEGILRDTPNFLDVENPLGEIYAELERIARAAVMMKPPLK